MANVIAAAADSLAEQLRSQSWGFVDAFLTGPEADALREYALAQRQDGTLALGRNAHEGPTGTKKATKNDEYAFIVPECAAAEPLRLCARRLNLLTARLVEADLVS